MPPVKKHIFYDKTPLRVIIGYIILYHGPSLHANINIDIRRVRNGSIENVYQVNTIVLRDILSRFDVCKQVKRSNLLMRGLNKLLNIILLHGFK